MLKNVKKRRRFDVDLTSFSSENDVKSKSKRRCFLTFFNKALFKNLQFAGMHFAGMQFCRHAILPACSFTGMQFCWHAVLLGIPRTWSGL